VRHGVDERLGDQPGAGLVVHRDEGDQSDGVVVGERRVAHHAVELAGAPGGLVADQEARLVQARPVVVDVVQVERNVAVAVVARGRDPAEATEHVGEVPARQSDLDVLPLGRHCEHAGRRLRR
jgi:hypothetical protein